MTNFLNQLIIVVWWFYKVTILLFYLFKFHLYLLDNEIVSNNPSDLIESQKNKRNFPDTLSVDEINQILDNAKNISKEFLISELCPVSCGEC